MTTKPFLAHSLEVFRASVNKRFPKRDKKSDGWIGDAAHAKTKSEHNPDNSGCVHAIDIDIDDGDPGRDLRREILAVAIGHPCVWYVISNGIIYSRTYGWKARKYMGANGHFEHVHVSILLTDTAENDKTFVLKYTEAPSQWGGLYGGLPGTRRIGRWSRGNDVRELQRVLNAWYPDVTPLVVDGEFGGTTVGRVIYMQKKADLKADGIVGGLTWQ